MPRRDSDGRTDFAVYQPGGGANRADPAGTQAYWRWCLTSSSNPPTNTSCGALPQTTCTTNCFAYGLRQQVPTPGLEFDGTLPNEFSVYDPSNATWYWKPQSGSYSSRTIGYANTGSVPLAGHYDGDFLSDLVVWDPVDGAYFYRRSQQAWNTHGMKFMGLQFTAFGTGSSSARAGALPMPMFRPLNICSPYCWTYKRLVFSLWWPYDGTWNTVWDPFGTGALDPPCAYGLNRADQPFSGFDRNGDSRADMGIYRDTAAFGSATIYTRASVAGACNGANQNPTCATCGIRTRAFAVSDMTGDGKEEIVLVHTDSMLIEWRTSESNYATTGGSWSVSDPLAVFL